MCMCDEQKRNRLSGHIARDCRQRESIPYTARKCQRHVSETSSSVRCIFSLCHYKPLLQSGVYIFTKSL